MTIYCSNCGAANEDFAEFCASCGENLKLGKKDKSKEAGSASSTPQPKSSTSTKLYRSNKNKVIAGISESIGKQLNLDTDTVRLLWVLGLIITGGTAAIAYLILWAVAEPEPIS